MNKVSLDLSKVSKIFKVNKVKESTPCRRNFTLEDRGFGVFIDRYDYLQRDFEKYFKKTANVESLKNEMARSL